MYARDRKAYVSFAYVEYNLRIYARSKKPYVSFPYIEYNLRMYARGKKPYVSFPYIEYNLRLYARERKSNNTVKDIIAMISTFYDDHSTLSIKMGWYVGYHVLLGTNILFYRWLSLASRSNFIASWNL